jgi:predicted TIM-barrel fold metal-dependent hydrolase
MKPSSAENGLYEAIQELDVVDAHEHLPPERVRLAEQVDVFSLFSYYTDMDLIASGMPRECLDLMRDPTVPLESRWEMVAPYWESVRHGGYARAGLIAAKDLYGFDGINETNYCALSERISAENKPGIYHRILRDRCRIRVALTESVRIYPQVTLDDFDLDLLVPIMHLTLYADVQSREAVEENAAELGKAVVTLGDYLDLVEEGLRTWKSKGVVGLKMWSFAFDTPDCTGAASLFDRLMQNRLSDPVEFNQLRSFLTERIIGMAACLGLVIAVHTGMWGDFRRQASQHMIPVIQRHPDVRFDIYHMGIPYVRETALLAKNFPNVWLNLCWCHIISPRMAWSAMDELLDLVPTNKIIAFGGDHSTDVENVYGHLVVARQNVAGVLGRRIEEGLLTERDAFEIASRWFCDNPRELYQLPS